MERAGDLLWVRPDFMPVSSTNLDTVELQQAYKMGHAQALRELPRWREFLYGSSTATTGNVT